MPHLLLLYRAAPENCDIVAGGGHDNVTPPGGGTRHRPFTAPSRGRLRSDTLGIVTQRYFEARRGLACQDSS